MPATGWTTSSSRSSASRSPRSPRSPPPPPPPSPDRSPRRLRSRNRRPRRPWRPSPSSSPPLLALLLPLPLPRDCWPPEPCWSPPWSLPASDPRSSVLVARSPRWPLSAPLVSVPSLAPASREPLRRCRRCVSFGESFCSPWAAGTSVLADGSGTVGSLVFCGSGRQRLMCRCHVPWFPESQRLVRSCASRMSP